MLYETAKYLIDPYVVCILLLGAALTSLWLRLRHERRSSLRMAITAYLLSIVIAIPAVSYLPIRWIECHYAPLSDDANGAHAIVVLGGGLAPASSVLVPPELSPSSSRRCLFAIELYRKLGPLPIFVTGAKAEPEIPGLGEAMTMHDFLVKLGIKPESVHIEANSFTTHDNAVFTARMLQEAGIHRILLVTEALHMPRSEASFRKEGIEVVPAPCSYRTTEFQWKPAMFLPSVLGLTRSSEAAHEWIGYGWYWLTGKLK